MRTTHVRSWFVTTCFILASVLAGSVGCRVLDRNAPPASPPLLPGQTADVFTTARPTLAAAVNDFIGRHPVVVEQPFEFPHNIHAGKDIPCTEYCHEAVTQGPVAGLPSVRTCITCHRTVATNRPRILRITAMRDEGRDFAWRRVFAYPAPSHVRFNHAPHIRASVECRTCHGDIGAQTVAQRNVEMTMGFCVTCHQERKAPLDCLTCHF
ncbi:MAG TPA: cytochrome c3 family protein [Vicinamibacterales bacterium]|nr:cytochrome c3 family protein [Vicinamibacterales bacterium]